MEIPEDVPPEIRAQLEQRMREMQGEGSTPTSAPTEGSDEKKAPEGPKDLNDKARFKRIRKLKYDRRPSTWLKVWSKPEPKPVADDPELSWPEAPVAPEAPKKPEPLKAPTKPAEPKLVVVPKLPPEPDTSAAPKVGPPIAPSEPVDPKLIQAIQAAKEQNAALTQAHEDAMAAYMKAKVDYDQALPEHEAAMKAFAAADAAYKTAKSDYDKVKKEYDAKVKELQQKRFARQLELLQRNVTLGRWDRIKDYLSTFEPATANQVYDHMLGSLTNPPWQGQEKRVPMNMREHNAFTFDGLMQLLATAPPPVPKKKADDKAAAPKVGSAIAPPPGMEVPEKVEEVAIAVTSTPGSGAIPGGSGVTPISTGTVTVTGVAIAPSSGSASTGGSGSSPGRVSLGELLDEVADTSDSPTAITDSPAKAAKEEEEQASRLATRKRIQAWTPLVQRALSNGHEFDALISALEREIERPEAERVLDNRRAAWLMANLGKTLETGRFLPKLKEAEAQGDREGLNMLADYFQALHNDERKPIHLEQAWKATMAALATGEVKEDEKARALLTAVKLAPDVRDQLGDSWLRESFSERPERGMEVIATIGTQASRGRWLQAKQPAFREETLTLQKTAVDALLTSSPELARKWSSSLDLLADVWVREAMYSYENSNANSRGPRMERDAFGNIYWYDYSYRRNRQIEAVQPGTLLETRPDGRWLEMLPETLRPQFTITVAKLFLKVNEEANAFPYIEQLADTHPETANELAREFLQVWINNNDPNASRNRTNFYMFSYGYNRRADGIPLTRSKQERNLKDLAKWLGKLRKLPAIELDEALVTQAFTGCHSAAEVYRLETIEQVFGPMAELEPETIASLVQTMRSNLAQLWRIPAVQKAAKTNRRKKDIQAEVLRGYRVASEVLQKALMAHPDNWQLCSASGSMLHDSLNYQQDIDGTNQYTAIRKQAMQLFGAAAMVYGAKVADLPEDDHSVEMFNNWFYGALGASDLGAIDEGSTLVRDEPQKIREAILALPEGLAEQHMARFAGNLFSRMSSVNPAIKLRYLEAGFEIVGDHPQAYEAKKVFDYYMDLTSEIQLDVAVDGSPDIGTEPFGLKVQLKHTAIIEKESGGFSRYLQNQQNSNGFYNYGRPMENYRDKFEDAVRAALEESFEVMSVTFNKEDVNSKPIERYGWRRTPYAYILLKAKGEEVDRVPQLKIDLDFLDTSGYAVLPIVSPVVPVNASAAPKPQPMEALAVTQTLDERKLDEGMLNLEIKAVATGLVPPIEDVLDVDLQDFEVVNSEDQDVKVNAFAEDRDSIVSERVWTLELRTPEGADKSVSTFKFPAVTASLAGDGEVETTLQRYDDVDMVTAEPLVELTRNLGGGGFKTWYVLVPLLVIAAGAGLLMLNRPTESEAPVQTYALPEHINPFTVLGLLERIHGQSRLDEGAKSELDATMAKIRDSYFGPKAGEGEAPDLSVIAQDWIRRAG